MLLEPSGIVIFNKNNSKKDIILNINHSNNNTNTVIVGIYICVFGKYNIIIYIILTLFKITYNITFIKIIIK